MDLPFALGVGRRVAALVEVVVQLVDAAGAGLADLARVRAEFRPCGLHFLVGGQTVLQGLVGLVRLAVADDTLDILRCLELHRAGDVAVDVEGRGGGDVPMTTERVFTSMPCSSAMVAKVWRRSWKRRFLHPARCRAFFILR